MSLKPGLDLIDEGFAVFPAKKDKTPCEGLKWRDLSTSNPVEFRSLWDKFRGEWVGVDCGKSGLLVIDADIRDDGVDSLRTLYADRWVKTMCVRTPSGGVHVYYWGPKGVGNSPGGLPAGIDVRGEGGYVIAPGCGDYTMLRGGPHCIAPVPDWLLEIIRPRPAKKVIPIKDASMAAPVAATREVAYARAALSRNAQRLAAMAPNTGRNNTLNYYTWLLARMVASGWISADEVRDMMLQAALACGLPQAGSIKTITSAFRAGLQDPFTLS